MCYYSGTGSLLWLKKKEEEKKNVEDDQVKSDIDCIERQILPVHCITS